MKKRKFKITGNISWEDVAGEIVIFKLDTGKYFRLNSSASSIWKNLTKEFEFNQVRDDFVREFNVGEADFEGDLKNFIADLENEGLIITDE